MITDTTLYERQTSELNEHIQLWVAENIVPPPILLIGPPGIGKTRVGRLYAECFPGYDPAKSIIACDSIDKRQWENYWRKYRSGHMPILDELPSAEKRYQRSLMNHCNGFYEGIQVTFIATANSTSGLVSPLLNRCLIIEFAKPSNAELMTVTTKIAKARNVKLSTDDIARIAMTSNGSVREIDRMISSLSRKVTLGTGKTVTDVLVANGLTPDGYTEKQINYLRWLASVDTGLISEKVAMFAMDTDSVGLSAIEYRLRSEGLITVQQGIGRIIERKGIDLLESLEKGN